MNITLYLIDKDRTLEVNHFSNDTEVCEYISLNWESVSKAEVFQFDPWILPEGHWYRIAIDNAEIINGFHDYHWESWRESKLPSEVKLAMLLQNE